MACKPKSPLRAADGGELVRRFAARQPQHSLRLQDGGAVPGKGTGDKIPALYEPGEFVVSNDMLDAQPELRTHLRGLRENVLAQKGMTPEQADAKAMTGGGLRAEGGFGKLFPYNRPEKDIYAGLGKPASAPENTPPPGGILSPQQQAGVANGQNQRTVAVAGPANSGGASGGWDNTGGAASVAGGTGRTAGAVSRPEDEFMPGTKAVFSEGGKDMAAAWNQGKYTKAVFTGLRQLAAYPVAVADDVLGGAVRGAYDLARNPAEDAARAVLGMEDRKEPVPSAAPRPVANVPGADANQTSAQPDQQSDLQDAPAAETTPALTLRSEFLPRGTAANAAAGKQMDSGMGYIPGNGEGMLRSSSGNITKFNTSGDRYEQPSGDQLRRMYEPAQYRQNEAQAQAPVTAQPTSWVDEMRVRKDSRLAAERNAVLQAHQMTNDTTLRGQTLQSQDNRYGHNLSSQTALRSAMQAQSNSDREFGLSREKQDQEIGTKRRENAMKEFRVADSKDPTKWDEVASQQSYDAVRQIFPKIDSASEKDRNEAMPDAKAMAKIFNRARTQDKVGWDAMKFWESKRPVLNGMPDVAGTTAASVEQVGPFAGMVMLNGSYGDTILTQKDGRKLNLGILDARERKLLETAQQKGWGN